MTDYLFLEEMNKLQQPSIKTNFINGECYIQQDIQLVEKLKSMMSKHHNIPFNILGRFLDDTNNTFYSSWCKLSNIDDLGREWGQQYFKWNPDGTKECLNSEFATKITRRYKLNKLNDINDIV